MFWRWFQHFLLYLSFHALKTIRTVEDTKTTTKFTLILVKDMRWVDTFVRILFLLAFSLTFLFPQTYLLFALVPVGGEKEPIITETIIYSLHQHLNNLPIVIVASGFFLN